MLELDSYFLNEALKLARMAAEDGEVPVGAVVVCRNQLIAKGYNQTERLNDVTAHAEMLALTAAASHLGGKYLNECTLYVSLEPCPMCAAALHWAQLGRLVYGATDIKKGFSLFEPPLLHPKTEVMYTANEACSHLLKDFFAARRKK